MKTRPVALLITLAALASGCSYFSASEHHGESASKSTSAVGGDDENSPHIHLTPEKLAVADLQFTPAEKRALQDLHIVPGRIQYDDTRHIEVKLPTSGILKAVNIKPGDAVQLGDVLAVLSSPEVGNARSDVLKLRANFELAERNLRRQTSVFAGLKSLVDAVDEGRDAGLIVADMETTSLGTYREQVLSAYSRYRLAANMVTNVSALGDSGAVPLATVQQRRSELNAAEAALKGITEQSLVEAERSLAEAEANTADALRRVRISEQHLATLLGYVEEVPDNVDIQQLSHVEIRAPFAGTIEEKGYSSSERVDLGDSLCVLADTSQLWVAADIRERDWGALRLQTGQAIQLTTPGQPDAILNAKVYFVGRQVDGSSNAVPLIATLENSDGMLRPGQFVRVALPVAEPREVVCVPSAAVLRHDATTFVFVAEQPDQFRQVIVNTGMASNGWTEVTGVEPGTSVVSTGGFYLKSELLLEGEE